MSHLQESRSNATRYSGYRRSPFHMPGNAAQHARALMRPPRRSSILAPAESRMKFCDLKQEKSSLKHSLGQSPRGVLSLGGSDVE
jgi:hypothetical protein